MTRGEGEEFNIHNNYFHANDFLSSFPSKLSHTLSAFFSLSDTEEGGD
jgi:hypothetical protein